MSTTLSATHLKKTYKNRTVVSDVSMHVSQGEIVGLLGPNGAGKTTCFYMLVGLVQPDHGKVCIDDEDLTRQPMHHRAKKGLGYLPQEASVFRKLSVADNIMAILELDGRLSKLEREEKLSSLLEEFGLTAIRESLGVSLSGGERRRVEIARAVAANPTFMLLDEPFAGVDPISVGDIKQIITHLSKRNIGIFITDHNVRETLDICQRAYIVSSGTVVTEGKPESILTNQQVRDVYLGDEFQL